MPSPTSPTGAYRDEPPVRDRGDACPGALRLHAADDGRLARLRLPGGLLTARQALVLATAAQRLGDGHLDITSRGNVQLRGLAEACAAPLAETLYDAGLLPSERHERARNIVASPLAGEDQHPFTDVRLWVRELDALVCGSDAAAGLSGRFLFALDDGRGDVAGLGADVTLLAEPAGAPGSAEAASPRAGTAVLCVGADRLRVRSADAPRAALLAAETFLTSAAGSGAWRVRELPGGHDLSARLAKALAAAAVQAEPVPRDFTVPRGGAPALGVIASPDRGRSAVSVQPPLGRLSAAQWRLLVAAGNGLRVTPWRGLVVPDLTPEAADALLAEAAAAGLVTSASSPWSRVGACTGRPGCAKSLADVRADATAAARAAAADAQADPHADAAGAVAAGSPSGPRAPELPVYFSGCARRCGHPQGPYVDKVATAEGTYTTTTRTTGVTPTTGATA